MFLPVPHGSKEDVIQMSAASAIWVVIMKLTAHKKKIHAATIKVVKTDNGILASIGVSLPVVTK